MISPRQRKTYSSNALMYNFGRHIAVSGLLPLQLKSGAVLRVNEGRSSIFANSEKGFYRELCQDRAVVYRSKQLTAIGIFDGLGPMGADYSGVMARGVLEICAEMEKKIVKEMNSREVISTVAAGVRSALGKESQSGTMASIVLIDNRLRYSAASVGDSAVFLGNGTGVERLFAPTCIYIRKVAVRIENAKIHFQMYSEFRNQPGEAITANADDMGRIEMRNGRLKRGQSIIMVTDGISNNLRLGIDEKGIVTDGTGCKDLAEIIAGRDSADSIGSRIAETITGRLRQLVRNGPAASLVNENEVLCRQDDDRTVLVYSS